MVFGVYIGVPHVWKLPGSWHFTESIPFFLPPNFEEHIADSFLDLCSRLGYKRTF